MEQKKARIGFVGCGGHATNALYPALKGIPEADLVAVCDLNQALAERNAKMFGAGKWYTDLGKMLKEEKLDGAAVVGPPPMYMGAGKQCLDAGLPIFVEKPSAVSYKDALDLAEHAQKRKLWGAVGYMKRYSVCYNMAKMVMEKEGFGKIVEISVRFSDPGPYPAIWGIKENELAFLVGQVIHLLNLVRFFCGDVGEVYAKLNRVEEGKFGFAITVGFREGSVGVMNLSACEGDYTEGLRISGNGCWIDIDEMLHFKYRPKGLPMPIPVPPWGGRSQTVQWNPGWVELSLGSKSGETFGYNGELENFVRSCLGQDKPRSDLFDGAKDLQFAEAVWDSALSNKPIKIG